MNESPAVFRFKIDKEYKEYVNDLLRMATIQIMANLMYYMSSGGSVTFFSQQFVQTLVYILLGVSAYWLILNKLVYFE